MQWRHAWTSHGAVLTSNLGNSMEGVTGHPNAGGGLQVASGYATQRGHLLAVKSHKELRSIGTIHHLHIFS